MWHYLQAVRLQIAVYLTGRNTHLHAALAYPSRISTGDVTHLLACWITLQGNRLLDHRHLNLKYGKRRSRRFNRRNLANIFVPQFGATRFR